MKTYWLAAGLLATFLVGLLFYAVAVEPYALERREIRVTIPGLPPAFEGYRLLHLSDFEAVEPGRRERLVADIAREVRPDIVVVTGDLVRKTIPKDARIGAYRRMASYLGSLAAPDGVWMVQGHGEMAPRVNQDRLERVFREAGVGMLWDDVKLISRDGAAVAVTGIRVHDYGGRASWVFTGPASVRQGPGDRAAYLELSAPGVEDWTDYDLTGKMRFSRREDWVGFMVHSRLGVGEDRFYMAQRREGLPYLAPAAHGSGYTRGTLARDRTVRPGVWHRFRIKVETAAETVHVRARTWDDGAGEPRTWDLDYADSNAFRVPSGAPGIYAEGPGTKEFAELSVTRDDGSEAAGTWREPSGADFLMALEARIPKGTPMILLSHTPDIFPDARAMGIPLVLAGHTQGGQIRLPWLGPIMTDTRLGRDYASGLFVEGSSTLFVNRGVGTTRIPIRFLCPPEVAVIALHGETRR